jgi:hypothetical protein
MFHNINVFSFTHSFRPDFSKRMSQVTDMDPRIVLEMVVKFEMWPTEEITLDRIIGNNDVVTKFLPQSVWKDRIISNARIPLTDLSNSATHWWQRFSAIPPHPDVMGIHTTTTTTTTTLQAN